LSTSPALAAAAKARDADHHGGNTAAIPPASFGAAALMLPAKPATPMISQSNSENARSTPARSDIVRYQHKLDEIKR
jgi:hypothetical protein